MSGRKSNAAKWLEILLCMSFCLIPLFGCNHQVKPQNQPLRQSVERTVLNLAVDSKASQNTKDMAKEFVRRAEFYSGGELEITISDTEDVLQKIGKTQDVISFCLVEGKTLDKELPRLETFSLPYIFKNSEYMTSAMNSEKTKSMLDKILAEKYPMNIESVMLMGYVDLVANSSIDLTDFMKIYSVGSAEDIFSQEVRKLLNTEWHKVDGGQGVGDVLAGEVDLAEVTFSEIIAAAYKGNSDKLIALDSGHRLQIAYLLSDEESLADLTKKQRAAIEQAVVLASGYRRTLAEKQRAEEKEKLAELGVKIHEPNREKYFSMLGEVYQYQEDQLNIIFDPQLYKLIRTTTSGG